MKVSTSWMTVPLAALLAVFATPTTAEACTCVDSPLCEDLWLVGAEPPAFFEATVEAIDTNADGRLTVRFRDVHAVHGQSATAVVTHPATESCGFEFTVGVRYLIDAYVRDAGTPTVSRCSKTAPLAEARETLDYLRSLSRPAKGGRIFGQAFTELPVLTMFDDNDRQPLNGLRVRLSGPVSHSTVTDATGAYSFDRLPPGSYTVSWRTPRGMKPMPEHSEALVLPNARACVERRIIYERRRR